MEISKFGFAIVADSAAWSQPTTMPQTRRKDHELFLGESVRLSAGENSYTCEADSDLQPLTTDRLALVYEGRVDNRKDVADLLGRSQIADASDGQVLLAAYEQWGVRLTSYVAGEFSYAVYDVTARALAAGQDALGVRKIFHGHCEGTTWIASDLRFLFARFPNLRPSIDAEVFGEYFSGPFRPWSGRTIWQGVRHLPSGFAVEGSWVLKERRVWEPSEDTIDVRSVEEADEGYRYQLRSAVHASLRCNRPLLCDVSGGFDSSTVYAVARTLTQKSSQTIIPWAFRNRFGNEDDFRTSIGEHFGVAIETIDRTTALPFQYLDLESELPAAGFVQSGALTRAIRQFADRRGARSRLTGLGGDVLHQKGGAPLYLADWIRAGRLRDWTSHIRGHLGAGSHSLWQLIRECTWGSVDMFAGTFRREVPDWMQRRFVAKVLEKQAEFCHLPRTFAGHANEYVYRHTIYQLPYHERVLPDLRMPLISLPLFEYVMRLDWKYKAVPGTTRTLMRRALEGALPSQVLAGGSIAVHNWAIVEGLRAAWPHIHHLLTGERLADLGIVNIATFQKMVNRLRGGYAGPSPAFAWVALYLELWLAIKFRPQPSSDPFQA